MKVAVTGATGFVGRHLAARLLDQGHEVTAVVRERGMPDELQGRVETVCGSVDDVESLTRAFAGVDFVWHLVGIIAETRTATFERIVAQGTRNVVGACHQAGVRQLGYMSAMGTSAAARSKYHQTKYIAEEAIASSGLDYVILRPSVIYGEGDGFVSRLVNLLRSAPIVPVIGDGRYKLQPVYIGDLAESAVTSMSQKEAVGLRIDIGGPEKLEYLEILDIIQNVLGLRRRRIRIPTGLVKPVVAVIERIVKPAVLTTDQLIMMQMGNTGDISTMKSLFGISPIGFAEGLNKYLR